MIFYLDCGQKNKVFYYMYDDKNNAIVDAPTPVSTKELFFLPNFFTISNKVITPESGRELAYFGNQLLTNIKKIFWLF